MDRSEEGASSWGSLISQSLPASSAASQAMLRVWGPPTGTPGVAGAVVRPAGGAGPQPPSLPRVRALAHTHTHARTQRGGEVRGRAARGECENPGWREREGSGWLRVPTQPSEGLSFGLGQRARVGACPEEGRPPTRDTPSRSPFTSQPGGRAARAPHGPKLGPREGNPPPPRAAPPPAAPPRARA